MSTEQLIQEYMDSQPASKRKDMQVIHHVMLELNPTCKLWFLDGKNSEGKIVSNPNIGYGHYTINYADGSSRDFYRIGLSANTGGISVYLMGFQDKTYLAKTYGAIIGKASISGYCIKFKALKDIEFDALKSALKEGFEMK